MSFEEHKKEVYECVECEQIVENVWYKMTEDQEVKAPYDKKKGKLMRQ